MKKTNALNDSSFTKKKMENLPTPKDSLAESPKKRFQRVDPSKVTFVNEILKDNTYKNGSSGTFADKANQDLLPTRGKSFTKEKNKKKKWAYKGGSIDTSGVHSFKFPSDSE
jgi:hypothetical protein